MGVPDTVHLETRSRGRYPTGFPVRCSQAEKQKIFSCAERANRSASRYLVELAIANAESVRDHRPSREELELLEGLMIQLRRLASTLQELASWEHASAPDDSDAPSPGEIDEAVLEVRGMLDRLRACLG